MIELSLEPQCPSQCPSQCLMLWAFSVDVKKLYKWIFSQLYLPLSHDSPLPQIFLSLPIICFNVLAFLAHKYCVIVKEYGL